MSENSLRFLGFYAELEFQTEHSFGFQLLERHSSHAWAMMGWVDIHYPCKGNHALHIRACLNPDIVQFESHEYFGGNPSPATEALIDQLIQDVREYLDLETDVSWHIDLQARSFGTLRQDPNYMI